jgi:hypothetical protein
MVDEKDPDPKNEKKQDPDARVGEYRRLLRRSNE